MDKVSASQPLDPKWVTTMIPHMTPVLVGSWKRTQE